MGNRAGGQMARKLSSPRSTRRPAGIQPFGVFRLELRNHKTTNRLWCVPGHRADPRRRPRHRRGQGINRGTLRDRAGLLHRRRPQTPMCPRCWPSTRQNGSPIGRSTARHCGSAWPTSTGSRSPPPATAGPSISSPSVTPWPAGDRRPRRGLLTVGRAELAAPATSHRGGFALRAGATQRGLTRLTQLTPRRSAGQHPHPTPEVANLTRPRRPIRPT